MKRDKPPPDPRGGHVRLYWALIESPAWNALSATDQRAYVALRRVLGQTNNGDLSLPLSRAKHYRIRSPATLAKALRTLVAVGLIAVTRRGGCTRGGQRLPTLYRFTDEQVYEMRPKLIDACKATNDWKAITSIANGRALIKHAETAAREAAEKKRLLQKLNATSTNGEAVRPKTDTETEAWIPRPLRKVKQVSSHPNTGKASNDAGSGVVGLAST
ncbi:MAG: hypothetical protein Q8L49_12890 [Burkholderiaceae bacterium]|nr:hypothetical protein [Burkholderiaceae bacterium]